MVSYSCKTKEVWPVIESFWEDMGFDVSSSKRTGIIETKWISESDLKKDESSLGRFDAWLDSHLANTGGLVENLELELKMVLKMGTTEVYLSQRSLQKGLDEHNEMERKAKHY